MDNWPTAIETIVFIVAITVAFLGWAGALPWQRRKGPRE